MLREIYRQPESAWQRISLPALTRIYRNPIVLEERVTLPGYEDELRQLTVRNWDTRSDHPVNQPSQTRSGRTGDALRQRMLIENGISEAVQFFISTRSPAWLA